MPPGYLGHRLHRSLSPDARFRFVNYVEWATAEDWRNAHGEEFRRLVGAPGWRAFPTTPALYEIVVNSINSKNQVTGYLSVPKTAPAPPVGQ